MRSIHHMKTNILLVDDHEIMREGLRSLIEEQPAMNVIAEAENGHMAIKQTRKHHPDVILMDISMPDLNGIDATQQILAEFPETRVVALSMHSDKHFVLGMLKAGASGYLLKECTFRELIRAVRAAMDNHTYLCPKVAGHVVGDFVKQLNDEVSSPAGVLTTREREVLQLIAEGKSNREISFHLNISVKTVEARRKNIMVKLDLHSVAELTKYAIREGLTLLDK